MAPSRQRRNEDIAYYSLSAVTQACIVLCMSLANTANWRIEMTYDLNVVEQRIGIWQTCVEYDGNTECSSYMPNQEGPYPEDVNHLYAARAFVIIAIVVSALVLFYFLCEVAGLTSVCNKFWQRYGFVVACVIQLAVICVTCSLCQSYFNKNFDHYRLGWCGWLAWVGFILSALTTFASFLFLRHQDYW